jgi:hypothetical protein
MIDRSLPYTKSDILDKCLGHGHRAPCLVVADELARALALYAQSELVSALQKFEHRFARLLQRDCTDWYSEGEEAKAIEFEFQEADSAKWALDAAMASFNLVLERTCNWYPDDRMVSRPDAEKEV